MTTTVDLAGVGDKSASTLRLSAFTQPDVGSATGVSDRSVRTWANDTPLRRRHEERLQALRQIVLLLDDSLTPRGVGQWFRAHNRTLDGRRPLDVLADDDSDAVRRAATAFAEGAYL